MMEKEQFENPENPVQDENRTKQKILDAAYSHLIQQGEKDFTKRGIASKASVNSALIHYYFGSMQNLFTIALEYALDGMVRNLTSILVQEGKTEYQVFYDFSLSLMREVKEKQGIMKFLVYEPIQSNQLSVHFHKKINSIEREFRKFLQYSCRIYPEDKQEEIQKTVFSSLLGFYFYSALFQDSLPLDQFIKDLYKNYIQREPEE